MSAFAASTDPDALDYSYTEPEPEPETATSPSLGAQDADMDSPDAGASHNQSRNPLLGDDTPLVSDLEQEVLDEYTRLLRNVNQVRLAMPDLRGLCASHALLSEKIGDLAGSPASMTLDGMRLLERKTATVCTLLKASVYSIVLQQQIWNESEEQQQQQQQQQHMQDNDPDDQFSDQGYQHSGIYDRDGDITFQ
ncbi:hypothetical protein N7539_003804 [Penicillium diatomitis]|uniref:DASH complex subunit DAD3 n=1 Tax=Penicillium diatomitis TaxID=2819901 RepID=A0A9W9XCS5_9EURO|nr:uncharacterized protein N7539_003804 [Penicillium diatomitis]KAJ5488914.1 hypothetical protein N7539_003804 [Penicillium diatomitis]